MFTLRGHITTETADMKVSFHIHFIYKLSDPQYCPTINNPTSSTSKKFAANNHTAKQWQFMVNCTWFCNVNRYILTLCCQFKKALTCKTSQRGGLWRLITKVNEILAQGIINVYSKESALHTADEWHLTYGTPKGPPPHQFCLYSGAQVMCCAGNCSKGPLKWKVCKKSAAIFCVQTPIKEDLLTKDASSCCSTDFIAF